MSADFESSDVARVTIDSREVFVVLKNGEVLKFAVETYYDSTFLEEKELREDEKLKWGVISREEYDAWVRGVTAQGRAQEEARERATLRSLLVKYGPPT